MTKNIFKSTIASQLKQARRTAKLTQKSLAEIVGVSIPTIRQTWSVPYCPCFLGRIKRGLSPIVLFSLDPREVWAESLPVGGLLARIRLTGYGLNVVCPLLFSHTSNVSHHNSDDYLKKLFQPINARLYSINFCHN